MKKIVIVWLLMAVVGYCPNMRGFVLIRWEPIWYFFSSFLDVRIIVKSLYWHIAFFTPNVCEVTPIHHLNIVSMDDRANRCETIILRDGETINIGFIGTECGCCWNSKMCVKNESPSVEHLYANSTLQIYGRSLSKVLYGSVNHISAVSYFNERIRLQSDFFTGHINGSAIQEKSANGKETSDDYISAIPSLIALLILFLAAWGFSIAGFYLLQILVIEKPIPHKILLRLFGVVCLCIAFVLTGEFHHLLMKIR